MVRAARASRSPTPAPAEPTPTPAPVEPPPADVQALLEAAQTAFDDAQDALAEGDLGTYQELIEQGEGFLDQALALIEAAGDEPPPDDQLPTPTPVPTPTPEGA